MHLDAGRQTVPVMRLYQKDRREVGDNRVEMLAAEARFSEPRCGRLLVAEIDRLEKSGAHRLDLYWLGRDPEACSFLARKSGEKHLLSNYVVVRARTCENVEVSVSRAAYEGHIVVPGGCGRGLHSRFQAPGKLPVLTEYAGLTK